MLKQIYLGEVLQEMELKIWTDNSSLVQCFNKVIELAFNFLYISVYIVCIDLSEK